jgi:hypothetical protein
VAIKHSLIPLYKTAKIKGRGNNFLPGLNTSDTDHKLLDACIGIPIVSIIGYVHALTATRAVSAGRIEFLTKSFHLHRSCPTMLLGEVQAR